MNSKFDNVVEAKDYEDKIFDFEKEVSSEAEVSDDMLDIIAGGMEA